MRLIAVGRVRDGPEAALFRHFQQQIRPALTLTEIAEARGGSDEIKRKEAALVLAALPERALLVALDQGGAAMDTDAFAAALNLWLGDQRPLCFAIGGADGFDRSLIARADVILSLGRMTWPHRLVRVMLAEQIFRARAIATGHPYHRAGRPDGGKR
jgi:23S rRNA (pseudouridine1915-N3)-methyltransferase